MCGHVFIRYSPDQHNSSANDQFGYRTGIGIRRIKHSNTTFGSGLQVHLVYANAKAADGLQLCGGLQNFRV